MKNGWTGGQYSLFRAVFGAYLFVHFVQLAPWAAEIFSNTGVLPNASDSPLIHAFPNLLALSDGPIFVTGLLVVAAALSLLFAVGQVFAWLNRRDRWKEDHEVNERIRENMSAAAQPSRKNADRLNRWLARGRSGRLRPADRLRNRRR